MLPPEPEPGPRIGNGDCRFHGNCQAGEGVTGERQVKHHRVFLQFLSCLFFFFLNLAFACLLCKSLFYRVLTVLPVFQYLCREERLALSTLSVCWCHFSFWLLNLLKELNMKVTSMSGHFRMRAAEWKWLWASVKVVPRTYHFLSCVRPSRFVDVSSRSFSLCCDLLSQVCHTAVTYCKDALENHLHVIVGTLIPLVDDQMEVQGQVLPQILFADIWSNVDEVFVEGAACFTFTGVVSHFDELIFVII